MAMNAQPDLTPEQRLRDMCRIADQEVRPCYRASSIAAILSITARSVNRLHTSNRLANFRLCGSYNRYTDWYALELFVDGQPQPPPAADRIRKMCEISGTAIKSSYHSRDIASILGISTRQVFNLLNAGELRSFVIHNYRRVDWPSLVQFIER